MKINYNLVEEQLNYLLYGAFHCHLRFEGKRRYGLFSYKGEEFIYLMEGKVEFCIEDRSTMLEEDDSVYFDSRKLHGCRAIGSRPCGALALIYNKMS